MANPSRETGFFGTTSETAESNLVFVDTSLDTHLAILVVKSDTVSDFKKKIAFEHMNCFPKIENIHIHSLKVKHKARFYHLPDSMLVWSAFFSAKGNWFLFVDASSSSKCHLNQNFDLTKCTTMDVRNVDSSCRGLSSDKNMTQQTIPISLEKTTAIPNGNLSGKKKTRAKKKRKRSHTELSQDVRADQSGAVPFKLPDISTGLMDAQETGVKTQDTDTRTGEKKRKKTNSKMAANKNTVVSEKRELAEENQYSSGNSHADVPVVEKEKDSETTDNTNKNAEEEINMKVLTTADVQEDLSVIDQKNDIGIHKASSQVPARQSEEKLEEKHEIAVKNDYLARATEEIDFKDNFVHCEVTNANHSSMEMKSMKKVKTNGLPSASISTEVQSSSKLSADHKGENKSHVRNDSSERQGDSEELDLPKPKEIIAESSILKKKNASVVKSSLEKLPGKSGKRIELKTPKNKSPSDSSSMSDHTKSESDLSQDSTRNGYSANGQSTPGKGRSKLDILLDSGEEISFQKILRSSKRFKKAKLVALQNEANEANGDVQNESQPIEFVPESQPIEFVPDSLP